MVMVYTLIDLLKFARLDLVSQMSIIIFQFANSATSSGINSVVPDYDNCKAQFNLLYNKKSGGQKW